MFIKTPGIIIDNDATGAFHQVICGLALITLKSIGFTTSVTSMLVNTWNKRKCFINIGFGVSDRSYQSTDDKPTFGLGPGSNSASSICCIIHNIIMHTVATYFIGIILVSIPGKIQHKHVGDGLIDETGLSASAQSSVEITTTRTKAFSPDKDALFTKMQNILQFFLELLQVSAGDLNIPKCA
jgi:hypothetical protein